MMTIHFEQRYLQHLLHTLHDLTRDFAFEPAAGEPAAASAEEVRLYRLTRLLNQVRQMVNKRFYQLPESYRAAHDLEHDDWIQEMMVVLLEETRKYDAAAGVPYQKYLTARIKWRLLDKQRAFDRYHSLDNIQVKDAASTLKAEKGRAATPEEIAEYLGCDVWAVHEALDQKRFVRPDEQGDIVPQNPTTPHDEMLRNRLWDCIGLLEPERRALFVKHELEDESFPALFAEFRAVFGSNSVRSFQRHYGDHVFEPVKTCVERG